MTEKPLTLFLHLSLFYFSDKSIFHFGKRVFCIRSKGLAGAAHPAKN